jgi:hypothetical protein
MIMGGFHYFEGSDKAGAHYNAIYPLRYQDVIPMLKNGSISLPTEDEIKDRSKSDWLAKTIALLQTLGFVAQCIARGIEKLPMTELEIVTLAYTAINVGMFIAWWDKPRNVDRPIRVYHKPVTGDEAFSKHWAEKVLLVIAGNQDDLVNLHERTKAPMFYSGKPTGKETFTADGITLAAGVVFGAIHCIAWSFDFRSHTELLLWRVSSIAITAVPALLLLSIIVFYLDLVPDESSPAYALVAILPTLVLASAPLSGLLYVVARLTTIVLAFMNLSSLPPGAFQAVHWTTLIPHL